MNPVPRNPFGRTAGLHGITDQPLRRLIAWGDHLKVDQPQIDAQHQAVFEIAVEVVDLWQRHADVEAIKAVVDKLAKVLEAHFNFEERELEHLGYDKLPEHRAEHKAMLKELQTIRARLDTVKRGKIAFEPGFVVLSFVLGLTVGHISHSDMDYCAFARQAMRAKK